MALRPHLLAGLPLAIIYLCFFYPIFVFRKDQKIVSINKV